MKYRYLSSFDRSFEKLPSEKQAAAEEAVAHLLGFFRTREKTEGLGLKKLRGAFWEVRAGLATRILFTLGEGVVTFVLAGDHDDIRERLRRL